MILSADIGGTKTNVALFAAQGKGLRQVAGETYASREHRSLDEIIDKFLAVHDGRISRACFGVAGPVKHGRSETTNFAWEGGHSDFAPRNELEIELLQYLRQQFGRVSYERVVSGPGLHNIYRFFRDIKKAEEPAWLAEELSHGDAAAVISRVALEGRAPICEQALNQFVQIYGAEAGNLALKMMATAGVYLGGGIAPKIAERLKSGDFLEAFFSKGRLRPLMEQVPVRIILNDGAALLGAARWALRQGPAGWRIHPGRSAVRRRPIRQSARRK